MREKSIICNIIFLILLILLIILYPTCSLAGDRSGAEIIELYGESKNITDFKDKLKELEHEKLKKWYQWLEGKSVSWDDAGRPIFTGNNKLFIDADYEGVKKKEKEEIVEAIIKVYTNSGKENANKENGTGQSNEELMKYDLNQIYTWLVDNPENIQNLNKPVEDKWKEVINNTKTEDKKVLRTKIMAQDLLNGKTLSEAEDHAKREVDSGKADSAIYKYPSRNDTGRNNSEQSLEDMVNDADSFINSGELKLNQDALSNFSKTMYNILLAIGIVVAVIVGAIIGIKLMTSSVEEKADAKKLLVPYVVGCAVVFGGFAIWKIVVTMLQHI